MPGSENPIAIMFHYVYALQSLKNGSLYIGYSDDLGKRLQKHNRGLNFSTRPYLSWQLIHYEAYRNEKDAKRRERYLKTSQGSRLLKRMLKEYFYQLKQLNFYYLV
jgi:putative endonuclease